MGKSRQVIRWKYSIVIIICFFLFIPLSQAEIEIVRGNQYVFSVTPYFRTDAIILNNNLDLDNKNKEDSVAYMGIDYGLGFDLKYHDSGPEAFLRVERNGPFDYDAPLFIHNTLATPSGKIDSYRGAEILPHLEEFWYDLPFDAFDSRFKSGLFVYLVGNGISSPSNYENFSASMYGGKDALRWRVYYCKPDLVNKSFLGPRIEQEKQQGIHYTPNKADFFAADAVFSAGDNSFQPYIEFLADHSGKRTNLFSTPTDSELLGTFGLAWDTKIDRFSFGIEAARNFGSATSIEENFKDVVHSGYVYYCDASFDFKRVVPHSRFAYASGNKVPLDQAGDATYTSGKNKAFSTYSPLNTNLADSIYSDPEFLPLVAMGGGNGLNYGINRPTTFSDPYIFENLILVCLGLDFSLTEKLSGSLDWWYLRSVERGVGTLSGEARYLSPDIGNELDLYLNYQLTKSLSVSLFCGYFFPGEFYKEERDDTSGSLFTPFVRGDGEADGAYQIEFSVTLAY